MSAVAWGLTEESFDVAMLEAAEVVSGVLRAEYPEMGEEVPAVAEVIVDELFLTRADLVQRLTYPSAKRAWYCRRDTLHLDVCPWVMRGGDEFGNDTVAFRVPFGGQVVLAVTFPLRRSVLSPLQMPGDEQK